MPMPAPVAPGNAQGAGPRLSWKLKMFLPDGLGTNVPDNEHPSAVVPVKAPFAATISAIAAPLVDDRFQFPTTSDEEAGVV